MAKPYHYDTDARVGLGVGISRDGNVNLGNAGFSVNLTREQWLFVLNAVTAWEQQEDVKG